jgi:hypothetical protein
VSLRKESTSSGVGGRPVRSKVARRIIRCRRRPQAQPLTRAGEDEAATGSAPSFVIDLRNRGFDWLKRPELARLGKVIRREIPAEVPCPRGSGAPIVTHVSKSLACSAGNWPVGGICSLGSV